MSLEKYNHFFRWCAFIGHEYKYDLETYFKHALVYISYDLETYFKHVLVCMWYFKNALWFIFHILYDLETYFKHMMVCIG